MSATAERWNLLKLANLAGLAPKLAYEARDRNVVHPSVLSPDDVLPLRTYDALRRVSWPGENHARNTEKRLRLWEHLAIESSRLELQAVDPFTGLYVHPAGAELVLTPSSHAITVLQLAEAHQPHLYLPLGLWAQQAREELAAGAAQDAA